MRFPLLPPRSLLLFLLLLAGCQDYHGPITNAPDPNWGTPSGHR